MYADPGEEYPEAAIGGQRGDALLGVAERGPRVARSGYLAQVGQKLPEPGQSLGRRGLRQVVEDLAPSRLDDVVGNRGVTGTYRAEQAKQLAAAGRPVEARNVRQDTGGLVKFEIGEDRGHAGLNHIRRAGLLAYRQLLNPLVTVVFPGGGDRLIEPVLSHRLIAGPPVQLADQVEDL